MMVPFLGEVPFDPRIRIGGDTGSPVMLLGESDPNGAAFLTVARNVVGRIEELGAPAGPRIEITD
jgi:ATP-binding protein involved in chromosome partitioning